MKNCHTMSSKCKHQTIKVELGLESDIYPDTKLLRLVWRSRLLKIYYCLDTYGYELSSSKLPQKELHLLPVYLVKKLHSCICWTLGHLEQLILLLKNCMLNWKVKILHYLNYIILLKGYNTLFLFQSNNIFFNIDIRHNNYFIWITCTPHEYIQKGISFLSLFTVKLYSKSPIIEILQLFLFIIFPSSKLVTL